MTTPLDIAFGVDSITGAVSEHFTDANNGQFQALFREKGTDLAPEGLSISWDEVSMPKDAAGFVTADGKAIGDAVLSSTHQMSLMADVKLKKVIPASRVLNSRIPGETSASGEAYISQQLRGMARRVALSSELLAAQALQGSVSVSAATVPGTQSIFSLSFATTSATSSATWATSSTDIFSELETLDETAYAASRLMPRQMIAGKNVQGYIQKNNAVQSLFAAGDASRAAFMRGEFDLGGKAWSVNTTGRDVNGSLTRWLADDQVIALPSDADLPDVLGYGEGMCEVPVNAIGNGAGVCVQAPRGIASYVVASSDPAGYELYVVWRGLFVLLNPAAVCKFDTTT